MTAVAALVVGLIFGFGLALSGMTDTNKVLGFLDLTGAWNPALMFVMGSAVVVTLIAFRFVLRRSRPILADTFSLPAKRAIDPRLLTGAAIFGIGWGIYGYCPGPALTALLYGHIDTGLFVLSMLAGMTISSRIGTASR
jgi:uncharacterized membrane protein YedE/YeeE